MSDVRFEALKPYHTCVGYVVVLLGDGGEGPVASTVLYPPTHEGYVEAMRHAAMASPDRKPAVCALREWQSGTPAYEAVRA